MKKSLLIIALVAILGGGAILTTVNAEENTKPVTANVKQETVTLDVPGMFCPTCPFTVRKSLENIDGVSEVKTSSETKTAIVTYEPSKVNVDALIKATTDVGYPSTVRKCEGNTQVC